MRLSGSRPSRTRRRPGWPTMPAVPSSEAYWRFASLSSSQDGDASQEPRFYRLQGVTLKAHPAGSVDGGQSVNRSSSMRPRCRSPFARLVKAFAEWRSLVLGSYPWIDASPGTIQARASEWSQSSHRACELFRVAVQSMPCDLAASELEYVQRLPLEFLAVRELPLGRPLTDNSVGRLVEVLHMEPDSSRIDVPDFLEPFRKAWLSPEVPADNGPLGFDFDGVVIEFHELRDIGLVEQLDPLPYQVRLFPQHFTPSVWGRLFGYFRWAPPVGAGSSWPFKNPPEGTAPCNGREGHESIEGSSSVRRASCAARDSCVQRTSRRDDRSGLVNKPPGAPSF